MNVFELIQSQRIVPVFSSADFEVNCKVIDACVSAGLKVFEFTNRVPNAEKLCASLRAWASQRHPSLVFGVGTVRRLQQAKNFRIAGAQFLVGPNYNQDIAEFATRIQLPYSPGCATSTELENAQSYLGEDALLKVFPGSVLGPKFVKSVIATNETLKLMITGGVSPTRESLNDWFSAGAVAVGMGSELISKEFIQSGDYEAIGSAIAKAKALADEVCGSQKK